MGTLLVNVFDIARQKERLEGVFQLSELDRLSAETHDQAGSIRWVLEGSSDALEHPQLRLSLTGQVNLVCQRCLAALPFNLASEAVLVLAKDDEAADAIEQMLDDDSVDVIVGSSEMDIKYLVEDDALLALPLAPKHEVCPGTVSQAVKSEHESPFSVLKTLK